MTIKNTSWLWLLTLIALCAFTGCSDDDDPVGPKPNPTVTETIGAAGGTLTITDELHIEIPVAALDADVTFTAGRSDTPPPLPAGVVAVSEIFEVTPSTDFNNDVSLTIFYDEAQIPQFVGEDMLEIYSHDGTDWSDEGGTEDADANSITADIGHFSMFVVTAPEPESAPDVYLEFEIERYAEGGFEGPTFEGYDSLSARFASAAPLSKVEDYLYAGDVSYGEWTLNWGMGSYYYSNDDTPMFFDFATNYDLVVEGSLEVTPLTLAVATMAPSPIISNLTDDDELSLEGFEVTWNGTGPDGEVEIHADSYSGGAIFRTDANDGSYTFTAQDLTPLAAGAGEIRLVWEYETPLPGDGYLEASRTRYETRHAVPVVFTGGAEPQTVTVTSYPGLSIPDGPSGGGAGAPAVSYVSVPATGSVESVRVYLNITHTWMSDLICKLRSPDGTELRVLFIGEGGETDGQMAGWYPDDFTPKDDLAGFIGDAAGGDWTLTCQDYSNGASGVLNEWRVEVTYK